jgi:hypothetical protein
VSNSSSSSFYFAMPSDTYHEILEQMHPYIQWIVRMNTNKCRKMIRGTEFTHGGGYISTKGDIPIEEYEHTEALDRNGKPFPVEELRKHYLMDQIDAIEKFFSSANLECDVIAYSECC